MAERPVAREPATTEVDPRPGRRPLGNRIVLAVLESRRHRIVSGAVLRITLRGRRSGRVFSLPVQYARDGDRLVLLPANAGRKRWWRNLAGGAPVSVLLAGRERAGRGHVLRSDSADFRAAAEAYGHCTGSPGRPGPRPPRPSSSP